MKNSKRTGNCGNKRVTFTEVIDDGEEANEFTNQRMFDQSLHDHDEHISQTKTICNDEIRARTTATDENHKKIIHDTHP